MELVSPVRAPGPNFGIDDRWNQTFTWFEYNGRTTCKGQIPKWNPNELGGFPYLAIGNTGSLSPYLLASCPFPPASRLLIAAVLSFYVAAFGTFFFLRRALCVADAGAVLGAVIFAASGFAIALALFPHGFTGSWIGLLALLCFELRRAKNRRATIVWGCLFALVVGLCGLTGQPELFVLSVAGAVLAAFAVPLQEVPMKQLLLRLGLASAFAAIGASLAAIQLLPTGLYAPKSVIGEARAMASTAISEFHPRSMLDSTNRLLSGLAVGFADPATHGPPGPTPTATTRGLPYSRVTLYVGSSLLTVALCLGVAMGTDRLRVDWQKVRSSRLVRFSLLSILATLVMFAHPITHVIVSRLPLFSLVDVFFVRWIFIFFLSVLGALAFGIVARHGLVPLLLMFHAALSFVLASFALLLSRPLRFGKILSADPANGVFMDQWLDFLSQTWKVHLFVGLAALATISLPRLRRSPGLAMCAVTLVAVEMVGAQAGIVNRWASPYEVAGKVSDELAEVRASGKRLVGVNTPSPTLGTLVDLPMLNGYELMNDNHRALAESVESCKGYSVGFVLEFCDYPVEPASIEQFGNIGWVLGPKNLATERLVQIKPVGAYQLYQTNTGLGDAFFLEGTACEMYRDLPLAKFDSSFLVGEPVTVVRRPGAIEMFFSRRSEPGCLFVSESFDSGWEASTPDGGPREISPAGEVWQMIDVERRDYSLRLNFSPRGFEAGRALSLGAFVVLIVMLLSVGLHGFRAG